MRIKQVLLNLLNNSVKFTHDGGEISIFISSRPATAPNTTEWKFKVRDTGIGIDPQYNSGLFQAFNQADSSTTRRYGGTGLGLAISKKLVELMGGRIWLESELGSGTTFYFTIVLENIAPPHPHPHPHVHPPQQCGCLGTSSLVHQYTAIPGASQVICLIAEFNDQLATAFQDKLELFGVRRFFRARSEGEILSTIAEQFDSSRAAPGLNGVSDSPQLISPPQDMPNVLLILDKNLCDTQNGSNDCCSNTVWQLRRAIPSQLFVIYVGWIQPWTPTKGTAAHAMVHKPVRDSQLYEAVSRLLRPSLSHPVPISQIPAQLPPSIHSKNVIQLSPLHILSQSPGHMHQQQQQQQQQVPSCVAQSLRFDEIGPSFALEHPMSLLLVEDNVIIQKMVTRMLGGPAGSGRLGYEDIDTASNGLEALQKIRQRLDLSINSPSKSSPPPFDLVLMDISMPFMDGIECTRVIRRELAVQYEGYNPYIVALTAHTFDEDISRCQEAQMEGFLSKPIKLATLQKALKQAHQVLCERRASITR